MTSSRTPTNGLRSKAANVLGWVLLVVLVGGGFVLTVESYESMPAHARVVVDDGAKTYSAPPYFSDNGLSQPAGARSLTADQVRKSGYHPDERCLDQGYFKQEMGSLVWRIVSKPRSRWNPDGSWNW